MDAMGRMHVDTNAVSDQISKRMMMEKNLKKLKYIRILEDFVRENNGFWNHEKWLDLCEEISLYYLEPIDYNMVGLMLEDERRKFYMSGSLNPNQLNR